MKQRFLEIGPGKEPIRGFETFNLEPSKKTDGGHSDHTGNAKKLPFHDNTYDLVYSSHCIEHFNWWEIEDVINEWSRVLKPGCALEIWTVNGLLVMEEMITLEKTGKVSKEISKKWLPEKTKNDPYLWLSGKIFNYAKHGEFDHHIHRSILTPNFLIKCFNDVGLKDVRVMDISEYRTKNVHGWINMGVCGIK